MDYSQETIQLRKRENLFSYRLIMMICFAVFLPIAFIARLGGWRWRPWSAGPEGYRSVFEEARQMSSTIAGLSLSV